MTLAGTLSDARAELLRSAIQAELAVAAGIQEALVSVSLFPGSIIARITLPSEAAVVLRQQIEAKALTSLAGLPITRLSFTLPEVAMSASLEAPSWLVRTEAAVPDSPAASTLSAGVIAGIVVASIALLSGGALLLLYMHKRTTSTSVEHAVETGQHAPKAATIELPPFSQNPSPGIPAGSGRPALAAE
jgi:hypothetical protein